MQVTKQSEDPCTCQENGQSILLETTTVHEGSVGQDLDLLHYASVPGPTPGFTLDPPLGPSLDPHLGPSLDSPLDRITKCTEGLSSFCELGALGRTVGMTRIQQGALACEAHAHARAAQVSARAPRAEVAGLANESGQ